MKVYKLINKIKLIDGIKLLRAHIKQLLVIVTIVTLSVLLVISDTKFAQYRASNEKDIAALSNNLASLETSKTEIETSLETNIKKLQQEKLQLKTTMDNSIEELKKENLKLKTELGVKRIAYLRPHDSIDYLPIQYGTKAQPSFGYKGTIKSFDFDRNGYTQVNVLNQSGDWAKISIEAYIPKWYLVDKKGEYFAKEDVIHTLKTKKMYTKAQGEMKVAPDKNSHTLLTLKKGKVVFITKEYKDWYYIELQQVYKESDFSEGWVKKSQLGTLKDTEPLEVIIKHGTLVMEYYNTSEKEERVLNYDVPVYLIKEKNIGNWVYGEAAGNWGFWINKKDIDFSYNLRK